MGISGDCHANTLSPRQVLIVFDDSYSRRSLPEGSLKENVRIKGLNSRLESGDVLYLNHGRVELRITFGCEPCGRLNKVRPNLCRDIQGERGYLARVVSGGLLKVGDKLGLTKGVYPPFSEDWHERVVSVARQLPSDHFLSYTKLALLAGVAKTYCRAFPRILEGHPELPLDRILPATGAPCALPEWDGYEIFTSEDLFHNLRNHNHNGALPIT